MTSSESETSPFGDKNLPACTKPIDVKVDGEIPEWVHGVLYRVGKTNLYLFSFVKSNVCSL